MKCGNYLSALLFALFGLAVTSISSASEVLYDGSGFVTGQQSFVQAFNLSDPGTLTVTLSNVSWPEQLASLNLVIGSPSGLLGAEMGAQTETFNINSGGLFYAQWFGTAQGPLDIGVYSLKVTFQPSGVNPVPLPGTLLLLASGVGMLIWQRRQRRQSASLIAQF